MVDLTSWSLLMIHVAIIAVVAVLTVARVSALQRRSSSGRAL
ncbi:hypothetical protein [Nonomuraea rubra]